MDFEVYGDDNIFKIIALNSKLFIMLKENAENGLSFMEISHSWIKFHS